MPPIDFSAFSDIPEQLDRIERDVAQIKQMLSGEGSTPFTPPPENPEPPAPPPHPPTTPDENQGGAGGSPYKIGVSETEVGNRARMIAWYPGIRFGAHDQRGRDGLQGIPSNHLRWKPKSDKGGLALLIPSKLPVGKIWFPDGSTRTLAQITADKGNSISNQFRLTVYRSKRGDAFGNGKLVVELRGGNGYMVADIVGSSNRHSTPYKIQSTNPFTGQSQPPPSAPEDSGVEPHPGKTGMAWDTGILYLAPDLAARVIRTPKFEWEDGREVATSLRPHGGNMKDGRPRSIPGVYQFTEADPSRTWAGVVINLPRGFYKARVPAPSRFVENDPPGEDTIIIKPS